MHDLHIGPMLIEPADPRNPDDCIFLFPDGFEGFEGGVEATGEKINRSNGDGAFSLDSFLAARVMTLRGGMTAPTPSLLIHKTRLFTSQFRGDREITVSATDEAGHSWRRVRRQKTPIITRNGNDRCYAEFEVTMWAPDPHFYGRTRKSVPGAPSYHRGNSDAVPRVIVMGPHPTGYKLGDGRGGEIIVTQPLSAGVQDVIDLDEGWVRRNGVLISGAVSKFKPWTIPPYGQVVHTFTGGSGWVSIEVTDTSE